MILITAALKAETAELIKQLGLKHENAPFPIYKNDDFILILSGVGKEKCAAAVGWIFGKYGYFDGAVNIGCAGSSDKKINVGTLCLGNAIECANNNRIYIPDILYSHNLNECKIRTYDSVVENLQCCEDGVICDMEAFGFATAVSSFLTNDRYACMKLISDFTDEINTVSKEKLVDLCGKASNEIISFLHCFKEYCNSCKEERKDILTDVINTVSEKYSLTESRRNILKTELHNTLIYYSSVPDLNLLPQADGSEKKHTAKAFNELIRNLKSNTNCISVAAHIPAENSSRHCFGHIYVENDVADTEYVKNLLKKFKNSTVVRISDYKSVFGRKKQNVKKQSYNKNLILAKAKGKLLYKGSEYCNAFGFDKFYYCSTVMGCIYNCAYCYLQGMYASSNITAFVNTEDFFREIESVDDGKEMLMCCSYDSDMLAVDGIFNMADKWIDFAQSRPNITFEIRTKSASAAPFNDRKPVENIIVAYTLSPESVAKEYEKFAPPASVRLDCAERLAKAGWRVRLCIEPVLAPVVNEKYYFELADEIIKSTYKYAFEDIVVGGFRMNSAYFRNIADINTDCKLFANPYMKESGKGVFYEGSENIVERLAEYIRQSTDVAVIRFENET